MKRVSLYRIFLIVRMAVKFFTQVILFQKRHQGKWNEQTTRKWELLLQRQAAEYKRTALYLEGLLIKLGQFLSTRADIMPKIFIAELETLVDQVPSVPWEKARAVLEEEWGLPYGEVLHKISERPIASASIGEVYHGYLHNGDSVAVKIQRPGIDKILYTDFKAMRIVLWLADRFTSFGKQADLPSLYKEMTSIIGQELNFKRELQNGIYFKKRYEDFAGVKVPSYYAEHSTKRVLIMEWMEGARITSIPYLEEKGIDRRVLAQLLLRCFLEQLLQEGKFHADPHPGNLLVQEDGTIVLLDFGMVGEIKREDAQSVRMLVEGIVLDNYDKVIDALEALRFLLPHANKGELKQVITLLVRTYVEQDLTNMDDTVVQQILEDIQHIVKQQPIQLPSEFAFFGRAISTFVGILYILDPEIDLLQTAKPLVLDWLKSNSEQAGNSVLNVAVQSLKPLLTLPHKLQQALEEPAKYREWKQERAHVDMQHTLLLSKRRDAFLLMLCSLAALYGSVFFTHTLLIYGSGGLLFISVLYYIAVLVSHRRLLRKSKEKG